MKLQVSLEQYEAERSDFQLVLDAIDRMQKASLEELRDLDWLHDTICSVGLGILHPADEIYADQAHLMNSSHQGITQYPMEFARWLRLLADHEIRTYLEIGCYNGGTACLAAGYLRRFHPDFRAITADVTPWFIFHHLVRDILPLDYLVGATSYQFIGQNFDAVFIDGDHGFPWAWADYQNIGRDARVCGFHDVNGQFFRDNEPINGVPAVWELIQQTEGGPSVEFLEFFDHPIEYFGIGVRLCNR